MIMIDSILWKDIGRIFPNGKLFLAAYDVNQLIHPYEHIHT